MKNLSRDTIVREYRRIEDALSSGKVPLEEVQAVQGVYQTICWVLRAGAMRPSKVYLPKKKARR